MKKLIILFFPILLASCFGPSNDELQKAKNELLNTGATVQNASWETVTTNETSSGTLQTQTQKSYVNISSSWSYDFDIEQLWSSDWGQPDTNKIDITGVVWNKNIDKIIVSFQNKESSFPSDEYTLKTFKKWDGRFLYRAYREYKVLDFWLNEYEIVSYIWEKVSSRVKIELFLANSLKEASSSLSGTGIVSIPSAFTGDILEVLPTDETTYGTPNVEKEQGIFTYSELKDFQGTKNDEIGWVNCENFADYLKQNYTWYYWNTCRPITDENNFSVNVLTLTGDEYRYERHYISAKYGIYAKLLLESGNGMMQDELQAKNDELKTKTFVWVEKSDKLMKDILK